MGKKLDEAPDQAAAAACILIIITAALVIEILSQAGCGHRTDFTLSNLAAPVFVSGTSTAPSCRSDHFHMGVTCRDPKIFLQMQIQAELRRSVRFFLTRTSRSLKTSVCNIITKNLILRNIGDCSPKNPSKQSLRVTGKEDFYCSTDFDGFLSRFHHALAGSRPRGSGQICMSSTLKT